MGVSKEESIGATAILLLWLVPGALLAGWAIMVLWGWFIAPLGFVEIGFFHAIGISIFTSLWRSFKSGESDDPMGTAISAIIFQVMQVFTALGLGWIVLQLMEM